MADEQNLQVKKLEIKIPYSENVYSSRATYEAYLKSLLEDVKNIALAEIYPFLDNYESIELPSKYLNWQIRAAKELHANSGLAGFKAYSENGLSYSKDNDGPLSTTLMSELIPKASAPKRSDDSDVQ